MSAGGSILRIATTTSRSIPEALPPGKCGGLALEARERFFSWRNIVRRGLDPVNRSDTGMWWRYFAINAALRREIRSAERLPAGRRCMERRTAGGSASTDWSCP